MSLPSGCTGQRMRRCAGEPSSIVVFYSHTQNPATWRIFFFLLKDIIHNLEKNEIKFFMHKNNNMKELKKDFYIFYIFIFLNSPPVPGPNCRWGRAGGQSTKISSVWQTFCWGKCARSSTAGWIVCNKKTQIQISRQKSWKIITRQNLLINN